MFVGSLAKLAQRLSDISFWLHCTSKRRPIAHDQAISDRSRAGLDWTNFFLADVQMGFGSFLAFCLAGKGWSKLDVGYVLTAGGVAGVMMQIPGGAFADAVRWKRGLVAIGIVAIAFSALILATRPTFSWVLVAELLHGITSGVVLTAVAAISLGIAGRSGMSARVGRNLRFSAAGNARECDHSKLGGTDRASTYPIRSFVRERSILDRW